jgi:hypothetical protein
MAAETLSTAKNTSVAGMMAVAAGVLFLSALMLAPRYGLVAKIFKHLALSLRILREVFSEASAAREKSVSYSSL